LLRQAVNVKGKECEQRGDSHHAISPVLLKVDSINDLAQASTLVPDRLRAAEPPKMYVQKVRSRDGLFLHARKIRDDFTRVSDGTKAFLSVKIPLPQIRYFYML
jgi:hypothetical protein